MRITPRILVIDSGAAHVGCAWFGSDRAGRLTLQHVAIESHAADPEADHHWFRHTAEALATLGHRAPGRGPCSLAVPGHLALVKFVRTPAVGPSRRQQVVEFEAAQNIPYPLDEVVWDWQAAADDGADLDLIYATVKSGAMTDYATAATAAGFAPVAAEPDALALARAFGYNYPEETQEALVVDIGARTTHLLFAGPAGRCFIRTLPFAGNEVTREVADGLQLDFPAAEVLKRQVLAGASALPENSPARLAVGRAAENFTARLQLELSRSLLGRTRQTDSARPARMYLTGGGALMPGLLVALESKLQMPVVAYDALRQVKLSPQARLEGAARFNCHLPILVGLAAGRTRMAVRPLNLLPESLGRRSSFLRQRPWWLAAAALMVAILVPPIRHYHALHGATAAALTRAETELAPLQRLAARNEETQARLERIRRELESTRRLVAARSSWLGMLADLQAQLAAVNDVWLERMRVAGAAVRRDETMGDGTPPMRIELSGRLLDIRNPRAKVGADAYARVKALMAGLAASPRIAGIEDERFDHSKPGILRFDFTLVTNPQHPM